MNPIKIELLTKEEASGYKEIIPTLNALLPGKLSEDEFIKIISLVVGICPYCYAAAKGCRCWDDS